LPIQKVLSDKLILLALGVWLAALGSGFTILLKYSSTPGAMDASPRVGWPAEAQAQSTALGPCAAFAVQLCTPPIDIGVDRSAHAGAQIPALAGQAAVRCGRARYLDRRHRAN